VPFGRAGTWDKPVFRLTVLSVGRKSGLGAGQISARRNEHTSGTQARLTRNVGCQVWSRLRICNENEPAVLLMG
jgi:hypothetical protein